MQHQKVNLDYQRGFCKQINTEGLKLDKKKAGEPFFGSPFALAALSGNLFSSCLKVRFRSDLCSSSVKLELT